MSASRETIITCDGQTPHCEGAAFLEGERRSLTAAGQRKLFKIEGWVHKDGKDYCPACRAHLFCKAVDALCAAPDSETEKPAGADGE